MNPKNYSYLYLLIWIIAPIPIGSMIGSFTESEINTWYTGLNRSALTPPNYVFPIVWTILYAMIGAAGWFIWRKSSCRNLNLIKGLYISQLILNWSWTPIFFGAHLIGLALIVLGIMDLLVGALIYLTYPKLKRVAFLLIPYFCWIIFATYLNFYIVV